MCKLLHITILSLLSLHAMAQEVIEVAPVIMGATAEDYAPVLRGDGLVFCSVREANATITYKDAETGKSLSDLYWVTINGETPGTPILFSGNLTSPVNEGPASFFNNDRSICFTRNQALPKKLGNMRAAHSDLGLFFATETNAIWSLPEPFEHNSNKHSVMHPAFMDNGESLIFASDMLGGMGGVDLYRSTRTPDGWSMPENLGPTINGPGNDMFPSIGPDGTLYFASDRDGGMGKLDIYSSTRQNRTWSSPTALPSPINSIGNDIGFTMRKDLRTGFFSSDRAGNDHIHTFKRTVPKFRDCIPQKENNYCYSFKQKHHAATSTLPIDHVWDLGDSTRFTGDKVEHCYSRPGTYTVRSLLVDRKTGATFHELQSHILEVKDVRQAWITAPDTVRTGRTLALDAKKTFLPDLLASEYHWDMGDSTTSTGLRTFHTYRTPGTYEMKLDVLAVPDANGEIANTCNTRTIVVVDKFRDHEDMNVVAVYQDALGKEHTFTYQELPFDEMGMSMDDLTDATFSVELFASSKRVDLDDPRFVEIRKLYRVVERFDPERGLYTYSVGETKDLETLYKVFQKVRELQFMDAEVYQLKVEKLKDLSEMDMSSLKDLNNTKFRTSAIHFDYKSAVLDTSSYKILQHVTGLLFQHPELQLVIEAHTDDVGSLSYNMALSQERAASVRQFLEMSGIEGTRLLPIGHGKNQPIATNKTEDGRQLNRRVEFQLTTKSPEHTALQSR